jgi:FkbM family methyltransferase
MIASLKSMLLKTPFYPWAKGAYRHTVRRDYLKARAELESFYRPLVKSGALVYDVGANHGDFSDAYLHLGARVIAVEPHPGCAAELRALYGRNPRFHVLQAALGAAPGEVSLHLGEGGMDNVSTVSEDYIREASKLPGLAVAGWSRTVAVKQETLEDLIGRFGVPDFCKIDVEGYELDVLKGLRRALPLLQYEYQCWATEKAMECAEYLTTLGMTRFNITLGSNRLEAAALLPEWMGTSGLANALRKAEGEQLIGDVFAMA